MKKNKLIAGAMSLAILCTMAIPVHAQEPQSGQVDVYYNMSSTFTLSIPAEVDISVPNQSINVGVKDVNIKEKEWINVGTNSVGNTGEFTLHTGERTVKTTLQKQNGQPVTPNDVIGKFTDNGTTTLTFGEVKDINGGKPKAGNYRGTLTFIAVLTQAPH